MVLSFNPLQSFVPNSSESNKKPAPVVKSSGDSSTQSDSDVAAKESKEFDAAQRDQLIKNNAISQLLNDDEYFKPNVLSKLSTNNYHFRLFMTLEKDVMDRAETKDTQSIYQIIDNIPKITIAETGVTAGINIESVSMEQVTAPGWRTRSSYASGYEIVITEPVGSSLIESLIISAQDLGVQNYMKMWYFLELTFHGYNNDGSINYNPCDEMGLENGGRWIYQISITNIKTTSDQTGSRHVLTCMPYDMEGFNDDGCGRVPENTNVGGNTVKAFLDDLGAKLTRSWDAMYAGQIYKINVKARPIVTKEKEYDPNDFTLSPDMTDPEHSTIRNIPFSQGTTNQYVSAEIPRGTGLSDVITSLYAHCESMITLMLDTSTPLELEDEGGMYKGKKYRLAVVPVIEPEVKVVGYDPITGNYMKEITYHVWGFKTLGANLAPSQYENTSDEQVTSDMIQELKDNGYLQKKYDYRFTGLNTEVTGIDTEFNMAFSSLLPQMGGWRNNHAAATDHEKHNPVSAANDGKFSEQKKNVELSPSEIRTKLSGLNAEIENKQSELETTTDEAKKEQISKDIVILEKERNDLRARANKIRTESNLESQRQMDAISGSRATETYAEDFDEKVILPYVATYNQRPGEGYGAGVGYAQHWHRGTSLVGALLNQQYAPLTNAMVNITLNIKGDPFWLGYSSIERKVMLNSDTVRKKFLPNFAEGDSTFAFGYRFPLKVDGNNELVIREDDVFLGVYRVTNITSNFDKGTFSQTLTAIKLELISPVLKKPAKSAEGTTSGT